MAKSHTDLIDELTKRLDTLALLLEAVRTSTSTEIEHLKEFRRESQAAGREVQQAVAKLTERVAAQDERLKVLEKHADHPAALSAHDQRLRALEKGTDRLWQFAPIVLSALALLTAIIVAFVKK